jgi:hypothetical protein
MVAQPQPAINLSGDEGHPHFPSMCYFVETSTAACRAAVRERLAGIGVAARKPAPRAIN